MFHHGFIVVRRTDTGYAPSTSPRVHTDRRCAVAEANRLARLEPGIAFVVFAPECECMKADVVQTKIDLDNQSPPF